MKHKWHKVRIDNEVYVSSDGDYHLHILLIGDGNSRLALDYSDGLWLYSDSRDFREYEPPQYVQAMFQEAFEVRWNEVSFRHYEYRKIGDVLVKDTDRNSLRYYDYLTWCAFATDIMDKNEGQR